MFSETEIQILQTVVRHARMETDSLLRDSSGIASNSEGKDWTFSQLHSEEFPITQTVFQEWVSRNRKSHSLESLNSVLDTKILSQSEFDALPGHWKVLYTVTRPGISEKEGLALVQVTAYCPAGPPNYGTIYLLQRSGTDWQIANSFGLYNQ